MNLENSFHNIRILAQVAADGGQTLLKTPSGKFKEDTIFERTIGCGKKLLAKIQGSSYELRKTSFEDAKNEVQAKLSRQIHFFSGITAINIDDRPLIDAMSKIFIEEKMPEKVRESIKPPVSIRALQNQQKFQQAVAKIKSLEIGEKSVVSKIKIQILDEKYFRLKVKSKDEEISPNEIDIATVDEISDIAGRLVKNHGESMRNAIILARLMKSYELEEVNNEDTKYKIAKDFADCYLLKIKENMSPHEFSIKLTEKTNEISIHQFLDQS
jgi:hypothetical protein